MHICAAGAGSAYLCRHTQALALDEQLEATLVPSAAGRWAPLGESMFLEARLKMLEFSSIQIIGQLGQGPLGKVRSSKRHLLHLQEASADLLAHIAGSGHEGYKAEGYAASLAEATCRAAPLVALQAFLARWREILVVVKVLEAAGAGEAPVEACSGLGPQDRLAQTLQKVG